MAREKELPPPLEMACLNALWRLGEGNVEEVRSQVVSDKPLAYTTVLTLLERLAKRGAVSRRKEGRGFRYRATADRDKLRRFAVHQLLENHFGADPQALQLFLEGESLAAESGPAESEPSESLPEQTPPLP